MPNLWRQLSRFLERPAVTPAAPSVTARNVAVATPHEAVSIQSDYARDLALRVAARKDGRVTMKARTLLRNFGYERRTPLAMRNIGSRLAAMALDTNLTLDNPRSLDGRVNVTMQRSSGTGSRSATQHASVRARVREQTSGADAGSTNIELADVAERAIAATVTIYTGDGVGSGFIAHRDGLVVTGCHVVSSEDDGIARTVRVRLADDREFEGTVFRFHRRLDFALLWINESGPFPTLAIGDASTLRAAETVLAIGSPFAFRNTVSRGIISNPRQLFNGIECIQTDASVDYGNSGGPLVNSRGEAIGVNLWGSGTLASGKFALPLDYVAPDIQQAIGAGRERCLQLTSCSLCGYPALERPIWFCRHCGARRHEIENEVH